MHEAYLLDTGVANLVALRSPRILTQISQAKKLFVPDIVLGELYSGAYWYAYLHQSTKFLDLYDAFLGRYGRRLLRCNAETAHLYGAISAELKSKGQPIQQNDVWIAALARQHRLTLATLDSDFTRITGLSVELWR